MHVRWGSWLGVALGALLMGGCEAQLRGGADARSEWRIVDGPNLTGDIGPNVDRGPLPDGPQDRGAPDLAEERDAPIIADTAASDTAASDTAAVVGNPALFTQPVFEMDFSLGTNGRFRAGGGPWQDFNPWNTAGSNGGWSNVGVNVQTTDAVRTQLVASALGPGKVLRTWIEAGDRWKASAAYPRTELTSSHAANVPFKSEWRLELPFYASGDVASSGSSIIGFQLHHNGNTGSPPFGLFLDNGTLRFMVEEEPSGSSWTVSPISALQANTLYEVVLELKFGYVSDGAYVKLWVNGKQHVDITDRNVGYPALESTAGYWKLCSLYDWGNKVNGSRSVHSGPIVRLLRRP